MMKTHDFISEFSVFPNSVSHKCDDIHAVLICFQGTMINTTSKSNLEKKEFISWYMSRQQIITGVNLGKSGPQESRERN